MFSFILFVLIELTFGVSVRKESIQLSDLNQSKIKQGWRSQEWMKFPFLQHWVAWILAHLGEKRTFHRALQICWNNKCFNSFYNIENTATRRKVYTLREFFSWKLCNLPIIVMCIVSHIIIFSPGLHPSWGNGQSLIQLFYFLWHLTVLHL